MLLRHGSRRGRVVAGALAGAALVSLPSAALAQVPEAVEKRAVLDYAPRRIGFRTNARVFGRLANGAPGDRVVLQRRKAEGDWWIADARTLRDGTKVVFSVQDLRRTSRFRLAFQDGSGRLSGFSEGARVAVRPKLRFRIRPHDTMVGRRVTVRGHLFPTVAGRHVVVQKKVDGRWRRVASRYAGDGDFSARVRARHRGRRRVRVRFFGDEANTPRIARRRLHVYGRALATWYGPGFYGNRTACGRRLTRDTLGVAHRRLACGTKVDILYHGRTITVPVIDRGPYSAADFDVTGRTARRLNFSGRDTIGVTH